MRSFIARDEPNIRIKQEVIIAFDLGSGQITTEIPIER